jgi:hypothetical protein
MARALKSEDRNPKAEDLRNPNLARPEPKTGYTESWQDRIMRRTPERKMMEVSPSLLVFVFNDSVLHDSVWAEN